jgi:outer membrane lipoprotein carrier protein
MLVAIFGLNFAFAGTVDQYLGEIEKKYTGVEALQASFTQETKNELLPTAFVQQGKLSLAKPSKLHWNISSPMEQHYYADAEKLTVWTPSTNQAIISSNQSQSDEMTSLLTNLNKLKDKYDIRLLDEEAEKIHLSLTSEAQNAKIELWFSQTGYVLETIVVETANATTKLQFTDLQLNPTLDEKEFVFEAQKDTDIIDSRQ